MKQETKSRAMDALDVTGGVLRTGADVIGRLLWIGVFFGALLGIYTFVPTRVTARDISAPQLASLAAECLAVAVIPYVLARAWDEVCRKLPIAA